MNGCSSMRSVSSKNRSRSGSKFLAGSGSADHARLVLRDVTSEVLGEGPGERLTHVIRATDLLLLDTEDGQQVARGGGDEHFVRRLQIAGKQRLFTNLYAWRMN